jgi:hypothetical protein
MPGCTDVIRDCWNGFLVPPRSPERLADRIVDLLEDRDTAKDMGTRASALVRQDYNLDIIVARYAALYEELMNGSDRIAVPSPMRAHRSPSDRTVVHGRLKPERETAR